MPVLDQLFVLFGVNSEVSIDIAVATGLASIIFSSIASARAHRRQRNIDWALIRRWAFWVVVGAVLGYSLVKLLNGDLVRLAFACVAILVAGWLILAPPRLVLSTEPPFGWVGRGWASLVGMLSALLGIGGGVLCGAAADALCLPQPASNRDQCRDRFLYRRARDGHSHYTGLAKRSRAPLPLAR